MCTPIIIYLMVCTCTHMIISAFICIHIIYGVSVCHKSSYDCTRKWITVTHIFMCVLCMCLYIFASLFNLLFNLQLPKKYQVYNYITVRLTH